MSSYFRRNSLVDLHTRYGYASFGFKDTSNQLDHKYGDRHLYQHLCSLNSKSEIKAPEAEKLYFNFDLIQSFSVHKAGNQVDDCEDIWHQSAHDRQSEPRVSIALSDGATESSFAREWAQELVTAFVGRDLPWDDVYDYIAKSWLLPLQMTWQQWLANQNLSWFAKRKAGEGAFATFLSLEISANLSWQALAVGDSCLFVVRDRHLSKSFPLQQSHEFNNRPRLIGTHSNVEHISFSKINGVAQIGDRFYLTTDAIACWIFKQLESNQDPWVILDELSSQDLFAEWVTELRDRHHIANDDTTLLCLEIKR